MKSAAANTPAKLNQFLSSASLSCICLLSLLLSACGELAPSAVSVPAQEVTIKDVGWILENRPSGAQAEPSVFAKFWLVFDEHGLGADEFASVRIDAPNGSHWLYDEPQDFTGNLFSGENGSIFETGYLYSSNLGAGHALPIGTYTFTVTLRSGGSSTRTLLVPAPGSEDTDGNAFVYSEQFEGAASPPEGYVALPKRAAVQSAALDKASLTISFTVDDSKVFSGWLWVYDAAGKPIGGSEDLRSYETKGAGLLTDGSLNRMTLSAEQFGFVGGASFEDLAGLELVLTDGWQYPGAERSWDTRSISERFELD